MAKERKEYFYNPIDFRPDVAVGVKLPFGKPNGLFKVLQPKNSQYLI